MKMFSVVVMLCVAACVSEPVAAVSSSASTSGVPAAGWGDPGTTATANSDGSVTWCCSAWYTPISTSLGETIAGVQVTVRDNGSANGHPDDGNNVIISLVSEVGGVKTSLGTVTSNGTGNTQAMTLTLPTARTVVAGESLLVMAVALRGGAIPGPALHPSVIGVVRVSGGSGGGPGDPPNAESRLISPFKGVPFNSGIFWTTSQGMVSLTNNAWHVPVDDITSGDVISRVCATILDNIGSIVEMEIFRDRIGISSGVLGSPVIISSNGSFTVQTLCQNNVSHTVQDMEAITVRFTGVGQNPVRIGTIRADIVHPTT